MNVDTLARPSSAIWIGFVLALYALYRGARLGYITYRRCNRLPLDSDSPHPIGPQRAVWLDSIYAFLFLACGVLVLVGVADLRWSFL
ncbi:hypothetical protein PS623_04701 [Pseudomonas fluorescens]|nr:hypothetical protein PS623_04701 [Pseudomonas fluorescens]